MFDAAVIINETINVIVDVMINERPCGSQSARATARKHYTHVAYCASIANASILELKHRECK